MTQGTVLRVRWKRAKWSARARSSRTRQRCCCPKSRRTQHPSRTRQRRSGPARALWDQGIGTEVQLLEARTNVKALEESIAAFSEQVDFGKVTAPFAGNVDRIFAKEGGMASPMQPSRQGLRLDATCMFGPRSATTMWASQAGQRWTSSWRARHLDQRNCPRGQYIEPANRTFEIVVPVPENSAFLPNEFAALRINDLHLDSAISLPSGLILQDRQGRDFVYVIEGGKAVAKAVTIGQAANDRVLI